MGLGDIKVFLSRFACFAAVCTFIAVTPLPGFAEQDCTAEDVELYVEVATDLLQSDGEKALKDIRELRFCGGNYLFVIGFNAVSLVHIDKNLAGKDVSKITDDKGKNIFKVLLDTAKSSQTKDNKGRFVYNGTGWVSYRWPKPGQKAFCNKKTFVRACKMGGADVLVGAGIYE